jgi:hypothetical protein
VAKNNRKKAVLNGRELDVDLGNKVIVSTGDIVTVEKFNTATVVGKRDSDGMIFRLRIENIERYRQNYVARFGDVDQERESA